MSDNSKKSISWQVIILAIPIIFSNLSRVIMGLADMAMVSRLGVDSLAATGMGSLLLWMVMSTGIGVRTAVQTVSARRLGQKKYQECGDTLIYGIILASCIALPCTIIGTSYAEQIAMLFLSDSLVIIKCTEYLFIGYFGIIFVLIGFAFQGFYTGVEETKVHMVVAITSNILNVYFNAGFIYGSEHINQYFVNIGLAWIARLWNWAPFPALGVKGAAIATLISTIFMVFHYIYFLRNKRVTRYISHKIELRIANLLQQIKLGLPISITEVGIMAGFSIFYKMIGIIGTIELATSEVILNIAHASFMPAIGVGMAASTLIGKYLGENKPHIAEEAVKHSLKWAVLIMGTIGSLFILMPELIISVFSKDPQIIKLGKPCLRIIGVLQYFDAIGITLFFVLTGAGNTRFPAIVDLIIVWFIFLPVSYYLGIVMKMGIVGAWLGFGAWIVPFSVVMFLKVRTGSWKRIDV